MSLLSPSISFATRVRRSTKKDLPEIGNLLGCPAAMAVDLLCPANARGFVVTVNGSIEGLAVCELHRDCADIIEIHVSRHHRRKGLGHLLLHRIRRLSDRIEADVPGDALTAHLFLRTEGFRAISINRDADTYRFIWSNCGDLV